MPDAHKNLAVSTVATAPSPAISGTTLTVGAGHGTRFPAVPFNATVWAVGRLPDPTNAEIVRVTAISTDTLTIVRAQESTSARTVIVGDQIAATITVKAFTDLEVGYPTFIQTTAPTGGQTAGLTKWTWIDTSTSPPTVNVEASSDTATTILSSTSPDDVLLLTLLGAL